MKTIVNYKPSKKCWCLRELYKRIPLWCQHTPVNLLYNLWWSTGKLHVSRRWRPNSGTKRTWIRTSTFWNMNFSYGSLHLLYESKYRFSSDWEMGFNISLFGGGCFYLILHSKVLPQRVYFLMLFVFRFFLQIPPYCIIRKAFRK